MALLGAMAAAAGTYFIVRETPPTYEARASLVTSSQDPNQRDFGTTLVTAPPLDVATYRSAVTSRPVLLEAYRTLTVLDGDPARMDQVAAMMGAVTVRAEEARISSVLRIHVRGNDANYARDLANAVAVAVAAVRWDEQRATRSLETIISSLGAQIAAIDLEIAHATPDTPVAVLQRTRGDLQLQLSSARALRTAAVGRLELLEEAETPLAPVAPRPVRSAAIAGILAVFLAYGLLLLRSALDTRVRSVDELARITGVPVLAEFPRVATGRRGISPEAASHLRPAIGFATAESHPKVILVTSAVSAHGKSTVSIALAEPAIISFGRRIQLDVIPSFDAVPDPAELLSERMPGLLQRLKDDYDVIIIDSAPVLPVSDSLTIAPHCTGVLLAVSVPAAERRDVVNTVDLMRRIGVPVLGTVATNLTRSRRGGKSYGYAYGYGDDATAMTPRPVPPTVDVSAPSRVRRGVGLMADDPA